jgi:hypothetical protein
MEVVIDSVEPMAARSSGLRNRLIMPGTQSSYKANKMAESDLRGHTDTQVGHNTVFRKADEELGSQDSEVAIKRSSRPNDKDVGQEDRRSSVTVITSPLSNNKLPYPDDEMEKPTTLKIGTSRKRKTVLDSESEDDVEVPKSVVLGRNSGGRVTSGAAALADHLGKVAAAATKPSIPVPGDQTAHTSKHFNRPGLAAAASKNLVNVSRESGPGSSFAAAGLSLPESDDFHLAPMPQMAQVAQAQATCPPKTAPSTSNHTFPDIYASELLPPAVPREIDAVDKSAPKIGLHLLFWLMPFHHLKCH